MSPPLGARPDLSSSDSPESPPFVETLGNPRSSSYLQVSHANATHTPVLPDGCPCSWRICCQLLCGLFPREASAEAGAAAPSSITPPSDSSLGSSHTLRLGGFLWSRGWRALPRTKEGKGISTGMLHALPSTSTPVMSPLLLFTTTM